jgi:hypothetical protein
MNCWSCVPDFQWSPNLGLSRRDIQLKDEMPGDCNVHMGDVYKVLVTVTEQKKLFRWPRHKWEDDTEMVDYNYHFYKRENSGSSWATLGCSRRSMVHGFNR